MIIACLQVRLKSKRFPKKAMANVKNKPLFLHVVERISSSKKVDKLIVCTSKNKQDLPIIDICKKQNIEYFAGEEDDVVKRYEHRHPLIKEFRQLNKLLNTTKLSFYCQDPDLNWRPRSYQERALPTEL